MFSLGFLLGPPQHTVDLPCIALKGKTTAAATLNHDTQRHLKKRKNGRGNIRHTNARTKKRKRQGRKQQRKGRGQPINTTTYHGERRVAGRVKVGKFPLQFALAQRGILAALNQIAGHSQDEVTADGGTTSYRSILT